MRVLFLNEEYAPVGGAEQVMLAECQALRAEGHEVVIVHAAPADADLEAAHRAHRIPGLGLSRESLSRAAEIVRDERPDVIHAHGLECPDLLATLAALAPVVRGIHSQSFWCPGDSKMLWRSGRPCGLRLSPRCLLEAYRERCATVRPARLLRRYRQCHDNLRMAPTISRLIVDSEYMRSELLLNRVEPAKIELIPVFPACVPASGPEPRTTTAGRVLFVGRLVRAKGWETLLAAAALAGTEWQLSIVGTGPDTLLLQKRVHELGIAERVAVEGVRSGADLSRCYVECELVVVPSVWPEPLGLVGLEAMAHARPVVASAVGGIGEWLEHDKTGLLVPPGDASGLAAAIEELLSDPLRRSRMGEAGLDSYRARFSAQRHHEQLLVLYETVIRERRAHRSRA